MKTRGSKPIVRSKPPASTPTSSRSSLELSKQQSVQKQIAQASHERRRLRAVEHSAPKPIRQHAKTRGEHLSRRLDQLHSKINNSR